MSSIFWFAWPSDHFKFGPTPPQIARAGTAQKKYLRYVTSVKPDGACDYSLHPINLSAKCYWVDVRNPFCHGSDYPVKTQTIGTRMMILVLSLGNQCLQLFVYKCRCFNKQSPKCFYLRFSLTFLAMCYNCCEAFAHLKDLLTGVSDEELNLSWGKTKILDYLLVLVLYLES